MPLTKVISIFLLPLSASDPAYLISKPIILPTSPKFTSQPDFSLLTNSIDPFYHYLLPVALHKDISESPCWMPAFVNISPSSFHWIYSWFSLVPSLTFNLFSLWPTTFWSFLGLVLCLLPEPLLVSPDSLKIASTFIFWCLILNSWLFKICSSC